MRVTHVLLVATATLYSCNAVSAASGDADQAKLSMVTSTDAAVPVRALDTVNGKRLLRSYYEADKDDEADEADEADEYDEAEEERGVMTPAQIRKWTARAEEWVERGKTQGQMRDKFTGLSGVMNAKDKEKYNLFLAAYLRAHPGGI
ncbi:hypothetical protein PRIC2_014474 [Phytophthora ramorum]